MKIVINQTKLNIKLENSATVKALLDILPTTMTLNDFKEFKKCGYLNTNIRRDCALEESFIKAGSIMLFGGDCLAFFYKDSPTTYSYIRIGEIVEKDQLDKLASGKQITIKLVKD